MVLDYPRWKKILVMLVMALGFVYLLPNLVPAWQNKSAKEFFALGSTISLGLDLQGGAHLLLEIDNQEFKKEKIARLEDRVRELLRKNSYGYFNLGHDDMAVHLTARGDEAAAVANLLRKELNDVVPSSNGLASGGNLIDIKQLGNGFTIGYSEKGLTQLLNQLQEQAANIIRRRVDALGNREALVSPQGNNRLIVQVPGEQNPETLKNAIGKTAKLTFHLLPKPGEASITVRNEAGANIQVAQVPVVGGDELQDAGSSFSEGKPVVSFRFSSSGGLAFGRATTENPGKPLFIVLDGKVISTPVINQPITGGSGIIIGSFTVEQTQQLALLLKAGALPAPLKILEERSVGAGLGADSIKAGKLASLVGLLGVLLVMLVIYRVPGIFANIALLMNLVLVLAVMSAFHSTLTLPGIAGVVLTMGVAVDANVLIYERVKEEFGHGRSVLASWQAGFERAFATIWDSHLTNLLSTMLLFIFGSGSVKGFALSLSIGIITSLFTAIMITRLQVVVWLKRFKPKTVGF